MKKSMKNKMKILVISFVLTVILVFVYDISQTKEVTTVISLQFDGIEKGLSPDDTRFEYNEIISEDVLKIVAEKANVKYTSELSEMISIIPSLPKNIVETIKTKRINGEDYFYYPNEFKIVIVANDKIGYNEKTCLLLLDSFKDGYEEYFVNKYKYPFINLREMLGYFNDVGNENSETVENTNNGNDLFDYSKYDYPEITKVFQNEFNMISSYLSVLIEDGPEFISSKGHTFKDLKETINLSKKLDLNQIDALVNSLSLTNDLDKLILKYKYMVKKYELNSSKKQNQYAVSEGMLALLESKESSMVVPIANGELITIKVLDDSYDTIASDATEFRLKAGGIDEEIKYLKSELDKLATSLSSSEKVVEGKKEVDSLVVNLNGKIKKWISMIEESSVEFFDDKYRDSVTLVKFAEVKKSSTKKNVAIGVFIMFCLFIVLSKVVKNK